MTKTLKYLFILSFILLIAGMAFKVGGSRLAQFPVVAAHILLLVAVMVVPRQPIGKETFKYTKASIAIVFDVSHDTLQFYQHGKVFEFHKL